MKRTQSEHAVEYPQYGGGQIGVGVRRPRGGGAEGYSRGRFPFVTKSWRCRFGFQRVQPSPINPMGAVVDRSGVFASRLRAETGLMRRTNSDIRRLWALMLWGYGNGGMRRGWKSARANPWRFTSRSAFRRW